jgi:hypothetical protein
MSDHTDDRYFRTRDENGEEVLCPVDGVSDRKTVTQEEMEECVDAATAGRYAGRIEVED